MTVTETVEDLANELICQYVTKLPYSNFPVNVLYLEYEPPLEGPIGIVRCTSEDHYKALYKKLKEQGKIDPDKILFCVPDETVVASINFKKSLETKIYELIEDHLESRYHLDKLRELLQENKEVGRTVENQILSLTNNIMKAIEENNNAE